MMIPVLEKFWDYVLQNKNLYWLFLAISDFSRRIRSITSFCCSPAMQESSKQSSNSLGASWTFTNSLKCFSVDLRRFSAFSSASSNSPFRAYRLLNPQRPRRCLVPVIYFTTSHLTNLYGWKGCSHKWSATRWVVFYCISWMTVYIYSSFIMRI